MQFAQVLKTEAEPHHNRITDAEAAALARTTVKLFSRWELSDAEARTLLGDMSSRTWSRWKTGQIGNVDRDLRARMAILMSIHKGIRHLLVEPSRGYSWVKKPNSVFDDASALDVMMRGEIVHLLAVREYLFAERNA
jgi:hypothetical protein